MHKPYQETGAFVKDRARIYKFCLDAPMHVNMMAELVKRSSDVVLTYHILPLMRKKYATQVYPGCFKTHKKPIA